MPRDPRELSLIKGEYRMGQSETVSGEAGDQPGAAPIRDGPPTYSELPTDAAAGNLTGQL